MKAEQDKENIKSIAEKVRNTTNKIWYPTMETEQGKKALENFMTGIEEQIVIFELAGDAMGWY